MYPTSFPSHFPHYVTYLSSVVSAVLLGSIFGNSELVDLVNSWDLFAVKDTANMLLVEAEADSLFDRVDLVDAKSVL